jgi:hypothetical protein
MTEEEWIAWEMNKAGSMLIAAPKHSLVKRMEYLEADVAAQRTAILRLEKIAGLLFKSVCALCVVSMVLALAVLT